VRSAFELSTEQRNAIRDAIRRLGQGDPEASFNRDRDLLCGIKLEAGGWALEWSFAAYVDDLLDEFDEALREESEAQGSDKEEQA
ncbi:MAG TPA: hypothetical protein ENN80_01040, partial [Candidatus Hydrogenedentes bacterium]|nr:hypothetical protein [Candidatus Hydrogenedentota bacterium]